MKIAGKLIAEKIDFYIKAIIIKSQFVPHNINIGLTLFGQSIDTSKLIHPLLSLRLWAVSHSGRDGRGKVGKKF